MSRAHSVLALFVLVGVMSLAWYPVTEIAPQQSAPQPTAAPELSKNVPEAVTRQKSCASMPEDDSQSLKAEAATCSRCPDGTPQCWGDRQCDNLCGGKGLGACVRINSCYKCCSCAALF